MAKHNTAESDAQQYVARFAGLVDIAEDKGKLVFLVVGNDGLEVRDDIRLDGVTFRPPPKESLTWAKLGVPSVQQIQGWYLLEENTADLFRDIEEYVTLLVALPTSDCSAFLSAWVVQTYLLEDHEEIAYSGTISMYGDKERGKGRLLMGLANLCYRADLTETMNPAVRFRLSDYLAGTCL